MANPPNNQSRKRRRASTTVRDIDEIEIDSPTTERPVPLPEAGTSPRTKFIVGLDYGTTYSSVSYFKFDADSPPRILRGEEIKSIYNWPNPYDYGRNPHVPTESWYLGNEYHWGYNARQEILGMQALDSRNRIIQYAKLLLLEHTKDQHHARNNVRRTLTKHRKSDKDIVKDFIREILKHTKDELEEREEFNEDCEVELVFCVPAGWPPRALRTMQEILLEVAQEIKFGILAPLFILNEPEAAAAYMLEALSGGGNLKKGDVFIVCDAGGGTVDTITYRVLRERPLRLEEVVAPTGRNCGSSYINQSLKEDVVEKLMEVEYDVLPGVQFEYIIEHDLMHYVEYSLKKYFKPGADGLKGYESIVMHGLRPEPRLNFEHSLLKIPREKIRSFFDYSLEGTSELIQEQIDEVDKLGRTVSNILLVGGFSKSPILREHLKKTFPALTVLKTTGQREMEIAVSHGAVFRSFNKEYGPDRKIQSNFGFLQIEEYSAKLKAHRDNAASRIHNDVNGKKYMHNIIDWLIKKNKVMGTKNPFTTSNYQTFRMDEDLVIQQVIYISDDEEVQSHYQAKHPVNKNAEIFGRLVVDLQKAKDEGFLLTKTGPQGNVFYEIHYKLVMEVDGLNLTVKLFCPPGGTCRGQTQLCISAAFIPGTK